MLGLSFFRLKKYYKVMNYTKFFALSFSALFMAACSDSSSTGSDSSTESSSSSIQADENGSSSSVENVNGDEQQSTAWDIEELVYDSLGFADIANVLHNVAADEKVVFVLRHAQRESGVDKETPLTEAGMKQAKSVGEKLVDGGDFAFGHTDYLRTEQTCQYIAEGLGQELKEHETIPELTGEWFILDEDLKQNHVSKDTSSKAVMSLWAYEGMFAEAFYDLEERSLEVINTYLVKDYADMEKAKVIVSHDEFLIPLVAYATEKKANLRFVPKTRWIINYLTGLAIIVNSKNEKRYVAVKGLDSAIE